MLDNSVITEDTKSSMKLRSGATANRQIIEHSMNVLIEVQKSVCFIKVLECNTTKLPATKIQANLQKDVKKARL